MVLMLVTSCQSSELPTVTIPPLNLIIPERPTLDGTAEDMVKQLIVYSNQLELVIDNYNAYIEAVNEILTRT